MKNKIFSLLVACAMPMATSVAAFAQTPAGLEPEAADIVVTLLGTGTPTLSAKRFGYSTLVQANGLNLVFDAGRGNAIRLSQLDIPLGQVSATFISHFHSDHLNGLPDLWATSLLPSPQNRRITPFELYGPVGIETVAAGMKEMMAPDLKIRRADNEVGATAEQINTHTFSGPGVIFNKNGVKVIAFEVNHGEAIKPSYGFRIEYNGRAVTLSCDTKYDQRVIDNAKGVDLLVHEVGIISSHHLDEAWTKPNRAHHTSPEEAGMVFAKANPKVAVFSHISRPGPQDETNTDAALKARAQKEWPKGQLLVGQDLMRFYIGDEVKVVDWVED
ncbi:MULTISPECIES: MBL fold metallo-hydrolase [unclassified Pseudomonas]|uniref:MBL fold metallo-hydrolase n=1 Tax=unclassified Pseudomonas TaxID=196821 RepID=UPI002446A652|nr:MULTISPECIES: MBL fold metallo-hydrolase [unclassified Pseudomonas]MDH0301706.1 MBL fold metallo-hydrolase [Pseudomonas sp. GD04091]MDH1984925.1 MBL fold metallo-hydrolase [Pseudomonas sp. GD03689]